MPYLGDQMILGHSKASREARPKLFPLGALLLHASALNRIDHLYDDFQTCLSRVPRYPMPCVVYSPTKYRNPRIGYFNTICFCFVALMAAEPSAPHLVSHM